MHAEHGKPSPINHADSLSLFGVILTILFYALVPSFWVKTFCVIVGTGLLISLIWRSDFLNNWKPRSKIILAAVLTVIVAILAIPQLVEERHKSPELPPASPLIMWDNQQPISAGTPLSVTQLDARSPVEGDFIYNPTIGTTLPPGTNTLQVTFIPKDTKKYTQATKTVAITVIPPALAKPVVKKPLALTIASHRFAIGGSFPPVAAFTLYINNNTGALLRVKSRSLGTIYSGDMRQDQRESFEKDGWEKMSKRPAQDREITLEPDSYIQVLIQIPQQQVIDQLSSGTAHAAFFIDIKDSKDEKSLVQLCGFATGDGELEHCATHNLP